MQLKKYMSRIISSVGSSSASAVQAIRDSAHAASIPASAEMAVTETRKRVAKVKQKLSSAAATASISLSSTSSAEENDEMKENNEHNLIIVESGTKKVRNKRQQTQNQSFLQRKKTRKDETKKNYNYTKGSRWQLLDNELETVQEEEEVQGIRDSKGKAIETTEDLFSNLNERKKLQEEVVIVHDYTKENTIPTPTPGSSNSSSNLHLEDLGFDSSANLSRHVHVDDVKQPVKVDILSPKQKQQQHTSSSSSLFQPYYNSSNSNPAIILHDDLNSNHETEKQQEQLLKQVVLNGICTFVNNNAILEDLMVSIENCTSLHSAANAASQFAVKPNTASSFFLFKNNGILQRTKRKLQKTIRMNANKISLDALLNDGRKKLWTKRNKQISTIVCAEADDCEEIVADDDDDVRRQSKLIKTEDNRHKTAAAEEEKGKRGSKLKLIPKKRFFSFSSKQQKKKQKERIGEYKSQSSMGQEKTNHNGMSSTSSAVNSNCNSSVVAISQMKSRRRRMLKGFKKSGRQVGKALKVGFMSMGNSMIPQHYIIPSPYETPGSCRSWEDEHQYYTGKPYWKEYEEYDRYEADRKKYLAFYAGLREKRLQQEVERERNI